MIWTRIMNFLLGRRSAPQPERVALVVPARAGPLIRRASELPEEAHAGPLPRFRSSASDANRPAHSDRQLDQRRQKLQRAFTPSQPVRDERRFAGRKETLVSLIRAVEEQNLHAVIFGDRGMGKTSMLHVFSRLAREARYIVRYTSCSETSEFDPIFRAITADIPLLYHADFDPTSEEAERGGTLADLLPEQTLTPVRISESFARLSGTRVLIMLDEFDRVQSTDFKRSIAELIKNLSDQSIPVQIVIAGVAGNLNELLEHIPSIRRNVAGIPVTGMADDEVRELIHMGEGTSDLTFSADAGDAIVNAAQGSPYVAGLVAQYAASDALDRDSTEVETQDVRSGISRALTEVKVRMGPASQLHLRVLLADVAADKVAPLAQEGLRNFGMVHGGNTSDTARAMVIARAVEAGVLAADQSHGGRDFRFTDDSVALYLWLAACVV